jgi:hypothetical protein
MAAIIVVLILILAILFARTKPWPRHLKLKSCVQDAPGLRAEVLAGCPHPPVFGKCESAPFACR